MQWPLSGAIRMRTVQQHEKNRDRANPRSDQADAKITRSSERLEDQRRPKRVTIETNRSEEEDDPQPPNRGIEQTRANRSGIVAGAFVFQFRDDAFPLFRGKPRRDLRFLCEIEEHD